MATSTIPKQLILGLAQNNVQTNANGFINIGVYGITADKTFPLQAFATSSSYPNGLIANLLNVSNNYWLCIKDIDGTAIKNTPVSIYLRYSTV